jgi:dihydroxyacetone kinase-like predicted kinase
VSGGQTMNPSTEDFLKAAREVHAKNVFFFPNNPNIVLAA